MRTLADAASTKAAKEKEEVSMAGAASTKDKEKGEVPMAEQVYSPVLEVKSTRMIFANNTSSTKSRLKPKFDEATDLRDAIAHQQKTDKIAINLVG